MTGSRLASSVKEVLHRAQDIRDDDIALIDVLRLTEAMVGTMNPLFEMIDARVYSEFRGIAEYIAQMKSEITDMDADEDRRDSIPRAGLELDAIVQATEDATNTIMEAAEQILSSDPSDAEAHQELLTNATMEIFEACSFQDITGQRISKVVNTLKHIESRVTQLSAVLGEIGNTAAGMSGAMSVKDALDDTRPDAHLLSGPSLAGEGIEQGDVDALLRGEARSDFEDSQSTDAAPAAKSSETSEASVAPEASTDTVAMDSPALQSEEAGQDDIDALFAEADPSDDAPSAENEAEAVANVECADPAGESEEVGQDDIDALFAGDDAAADDSQEDSEDKTKKSAAAAPDPSALEVAATGETSQEDIDALFD